jgi:hypothetical protein
MASRLYSSQNNAIASGGADALVPVVTRVPVENGLLGTPVSVLDASRVSSGSMLLGVTEKFMTPKKHLNLATWNITSGNQVGKMEQVCTQLLRLKIDLAVLTELRLPDTGNKEIYNVDSSERMHLFYSGGEQRVRGVGFLISDHCRKSVLSFDPVSDRLAVLNLAGTAPVNIIAAYAPTEISSDAEKESFYEQLQNTINSIPKRGPIILAGDLNVHTGKLRTGWEHVMGKYGCGNLNDNGLRLLSFAASNSMALCNTWFRHRPIHQMT